MRTNVKVITPIFTHEGGKASRISPEEQLRRTVMACMLWEDTFYEDGMTVADRIASVADKLPVATVCNLAVEARRKGNLRHAPLWLTIAALNHPKRSEDSASALIALTIAEVCQRADDMGELVAMYWKGGKKPLANALKDGLAKAFTKFDVYRLSKYAARGAIRLRDVMFMVHPKPLDKAQEEVWKALADDTLPPADTWESSLSAGADKAGTFGRLLSENKLGGLATLRNLRNMRDAGVDRNLVASALLRQSGKSGILPFQYVSAAKAVPQWEDIIEPAMLKALEEQPKLPGKTVLMVDVSGSMDAALSSKSVMRRLDAAAALAMLVREVCEEVLIVIFNDVLVGVPPRRGFALRDAIGQAGGGTMTGRAVTGVQAQVKADRIIIFTDEQSADTLPHPQCKGYIMNVASYENGIGYGAWTHISGFSENLIRYITESELASKE